VLFESPVRFESPVPFESLVPLVPWPVTVRTDLHFYPRLVLDVGRDAARPLAGALAARDVAIVVPHAPLARGELVICPEAIVAGDRTLVEEALAAAAAGHAPAATVL